MHCNYSKTTLQAGKRAFFAQQDRRTFARPQEQKLEAKPHVSSGSWVVLPVQSYPPFTQGRSPPGDSCCPRNRAWPRTVPREAPAGARAPRGATRLPLHAAAQLWGEAVGAPGRYGRVGDSGWLYAEDISPVLFPGSCSGPGSPGQLWIHTSHSAQRRDAPYQGCCSHSGLG